MRFVALLLATGAALQRPSSRVAMSAGHQICRLGGGWHRSGSGEVRLPTPWELENLTRVELGGLDANSLQSILNPKPDILPPVKLGGHSPLDRFEWDDESCLTPNEETALQCAGRVGLLWSANPSRPSLNQRAP